MNIFISHPDDDHKPDFAFLNGKIMESVQLKFGSGKTEKFLRSYLTAYLNSMKSAKVVILHLDEVHDLTRF